MKRGAIDHPKMLELAELLGVPIYSAVGLLESLTHWTAKYAPRGDVGRWSNDVIARGVGWDRLPAELIDALVRTRWIDASNEHRLVVHDWSQHADDTVHRQVARLCLLFADGAIPNTKRLDPNEKAEIERRLAKLARVRTRGARKAHDVRTSGALPEPVPEPYPEPEPEPEPGQSQAPSGGVPAVAGPRSKPPGSIAWGAYGTAYEGRYGVAPVRNEKTNAQMVQLCKRVGNEDAPHVAAFFVGSNDAYYVKRGHSLDCLVKDAEKLRTEWATNRRVNGSQAVRNEATEANPFLRMAAEERAKGVRH